MIFRNENNKLINIRRWEVPEQELARKYIKENDVVLELGARYGTVSCVINSKLNDKKNQVVVEPDERVWNALENNRNVNKCEFHIVKGFVSNKKLNLTNLGSYYGYGTTCVEAIESKIPSFTLEEIKTNHSLNFNVLVADCEGFLELFFDENPNLYNDLRMIIFEADYPDKCNYEKIRNNLKENNFVEIQGGFQNVWIKNN